MLKLITNADDFGLTLGVNRGIVEAWTRGIVNSVTIMANSRYFENAVRLVSSSSYKSLRPLSVGCHVVLLDGRPVLEPETISTLIPPSSRSLFRKGFTEFGISAIRGHLADDEIEAEAGAQISKLQQSGISVSHVDTHKHAHLFPRVLKPLLRAAKARGVRAVRNPFYPNRLPTMVEVVKHPRVARRYFQIPILRNFAGQFRRMVEAEGLLTTDGCLGVYEDTLLNCTTFRNVISRVPPGTWELVSHPGYRDSELDHVNTRLRESRAKELEVLTSSGARDILAEYEVRTISYWDLQTG